MIQPFTINEDTPRYMNYNQYVLDTQFKDMDGAKDFVAHAHSKHLTSRVVSDLQTMLFEFTDTKASTAAKHKQFGNITSQLLVVQRMFFTEWKTWRTKMRVKG